MGVEQKSRTDLAEKRKGQDETREEWERNEELTRRRGGGVKGERGGWQRVRGARAQNYYLGNNQGKMVAGAFFFLYLTQN